MNGEIDLVRNSSLQKNFMKSASCRSALQNSDHLTSSDLSLFNAAVSRMQDVRSDLDHLTDMGIASGSGPAENLENARKDRDLSRNPPHSSSITLTPVTCQPSTSLIEPSDSLPLATPMVSSGKNSCEEINKRNNFLSLMKSNSDHPDKISSAADIVDFTKLACGNLDGQMQFCETEYRNKLSKTSNVTSLVDHLTDANCLRSSNSSTDYRIMRASLEPNTDSLSRVHQKNDAKNISTEQEPLDVPGEFGGPSGLWNHQSCIGLTSSDHGFPFVGDTMTSLVSNTEADQDGALSDSYANGINQTSVQNNCSTAAAIALKRPITGAHQATRFPAVNKNGIWPNNSIGVSNSTLGYLVSNAWSSSGTNASAKISNGLVTDSNLPAIDFPGNEANTISWSQSSNIHQTMQKQSMQNIPNVIGAMGFTNGTTNSTSLTRTPVCLGIGSMTTTSMGITSNNNKINETGLSNLYSMFPKRPQHRMMAHWQQQQQHHQTSQNQIAVGKSLMNISSNSLQLNGNRGITSGTSSVMSTIPNGCGDSGLNGTSGGFSSNSILQSLNNTVSSSSTNSPLAICSSGDSFTTPVPFNTATSESSLDNFKYGLDQQLMEVIKSFEISSIGSNVMTSNANNASVGAFDDLALPSGFGEVEQQISTLNSVNQVPVLGASSIHNSAPMINGTSNHSSGFNNLSGYNGSSMLSSVGMTNPYSMFANIFTREEGYSRKVFVGGLPPDIDEEEITTAFRRFGPLIVDWPHKTESKAYFPPKGYCFLLFQDERSVQSLISACIVDEGKFYWCVSSPTMKDKPVQIRPWNLADSDFVMDGSQPLDPRKTIFVGGVPRPLRAIELALIMDRLYGGVCYAGIDTDPELKYPKGAGRVAFSNQQSYIAAISARFVQLQHNEIDKRVEVKPYVLDNQMCDECQGTRCGGKFAPFFCANVTCLQYYCEQCWVQIHSRYGREYHKPLVKEGAERPRPALYRW